MGSVHLNLHFVGGAPPVAAGVDLGDQKLDEELPVLLPHLGSQLLRGRATAGAFRWAQTQPALSPLVSNWIGIPRTPFSAFRCPREAAFTVGSQIGPDCGEVWGDAAAEGAHLDVECLAEAMGAGIGDHRLLAAALPLPAGQIPRIERPVGFRLALAAGASGPVPAACGLGDRLRGHGGRAERPVPPLPPGAIVRRRGTLLRSVSVCRRSCCMAAHADQGHLAGGGGGACSDVRTVLTRQSAAAAGQLRAESYGRIFRLDGCKVIDSNMLSPSAQSFALLPIEIAAAASEACRASQDCCEGLFQALNDGQWFPTVGRRSRLRE